MLSLFIILVDGSLHIQLVVLIGLPNMQEEIVVRSEKVEDLVYDEEEQSIDCVFMHSIGGLESFLLPDCHLIIVFFVDPFLKISPPHLKAIL